MPPKQAKSQSEEHAKILLEAITGDTLRAVSADDYGNPDGQPTPDFLGTKQPTVYEVKERAIPESLALEREVRQTPFTPSNRLERHWIVAVELVTQEQKWPTMPNFPDDPEDIDAITPPGFTHITRQEREDKFQANKERARKKVPTPVFKRLAKEIEGRLAQAEASHRTQVFGNGFSAMSFPVAESMPPGIMFRTGYSGSRSGDMDAVADRIQDWLDTDSTNMRESLAIEPGLRKNAVLIVPAISESEYPSIQSSDRLPTKPLELGDCIDEMWIIFGRVAWHFEPESGWIRHAPFAA